MTDAPEGLWSPLRYRNFRLLWGGFIVSQVGDFIQIIAQSWLVVSLTRSALRVGIVALVQAIPRLVTGLAAGVIVDRVDRRRLLVACQSLAALQSLVFLALYVTRQVTYGRILVLALALGIFDSLNLTARQAMMPTLVPRAMISRAVALQALGVNVTQLLGPSLGGVILGRFGVAGCLSTNALSFVALIAAAAAMRLDAVPPRGEGDFSRELFEGITYVRRRAILWVPLALAYALGLFGMPVVRLLPLYARVVVGTNGRGYGILAAASGVGAMAASLLVTARAKRRQLPRNVVISAVVLSIALGFFARMASFPSVFVALALFGAAQMAFRSATVTLFQTEVPDRLRGRVISLLAMDFALWSVGSVMLGTIADALARAHGGGPGSISFGLHATLTGGAVLCLLVAGIAARPLLRAAQTLTCD